MNFLIAGEDKHWDAHDNDDHVWGLLESSKQEEASALLQIYLHHLSKNMDTIVPSKSQTVAPGI